MIRWILYAAFGALAGAIAFVNLFGYDAGLLILLASGLIAARVEIGLAQRRPQSHPHPRVRLVLSAMLVFAFVVGLSLVVFLVLYAAKRSAMNAA